MKTRAIKNSLKSLWRSAFEMGQRMGVDVLPRHFYSQIPNIAELKRDDFWRAPTSLQGVLGCDIEQQLAFARECVPSEWISKVSDLEIHRTAVQENGQDGGYGPVEALFFYCFIRSKKPRKIIQVGCGVSTSIILRAAKDADYVPEVVCVEPYPSTFLLSAASAGKITLVSERAQTVDLQTLTDLRSGDLFFVDSTHTVKPGSEVNRIILEVLPRLAEGCLVHFHDIYFPYDYKRDLLDGDLVFWSESTLLHAFLTQNTSYTIRLALSMLHYKAKQELQALLPAYDPQQDQQGLRKAGGVHFPCSIYLESI